MESSKNKSNENIETNEEEPQNTNKYKEIIASLPKENRWGNTFEFIEYEGFWYPSIYIEPILSLQEHFKADPKDIFLCSLPKSGTTWLKALCFFIATRKRFDVSKNPVLTTMPHDCVPFMETDLVDESFIRDPQLPLLSSHLSYTSLPQSIKTAGCKIVYICREPKDTFVSSWHFIHKVMKSFGMDAKVIESLSFEEEFELLCQGKSPYGPFWEHNLGYWKASLERPENILFLKYEDMKKDTLFFIRKLARFLDYPFSEEEEMENVPLEIIKLCSFENLSNLEVNKNGKHRQDTPLAVQNNVYFRKGQVGDWKNHLTEEMKARLDQITKEKLSGFGLTFDILSRS